MIPGAKMRKNAGYREKMVITKYSGALGDVIKDIVK
jgi:hypothetical protein